MRIAFAKTLAELAEDDSRIVLLTGDLGYTVLNPFFERFPDRFINVGVAEQNMIGLATGLSEAGYLPFVYSIATFASMRAYEFIRNGPVAHGLPVRIVGVGGGFEYGSAGPTHYALEDLGIMRVQPNLMIISPADHLQTRAALKATWNLPGPIYYRLGKDDRAVLHGLDGRFALGRVDEIRTGDDLLFLATGSIATEANEAAAILKNQGINCTVLVISTLCPVPAEDLLQALRRFPIALTVEAHYVIGGLGSIVAELIAENGLRCRLIRCGVQSAPDGITGSEAYMNNLHGLSRLRLVEAAVEAYTSLRHDRTSYLDYSADL